LKNAHASKLIRAIRQLANVIKEMDDEQIASVFDMLDRASKDSPPPSKREPSKRMKGFVDPADLDQIVMRITESKSRDEGATFLSEARLTRKELSAIARRSDVHITKEDTVGDIELRLIETLIGSRLNSIAIRGDQ
jgi:hypothetical protein